MQQTVQKHSAEPKLTATDRLNTLNLTPREHSFNDLKLLCAYPPSDPEVKLPTKVEHGHVVDHQLRCGQLAYVQLKAMRDSIIDKSYRAPAITGINSDELRNNPAAVINRTIEHSMIASLQGSDRTLGGTENAVGVRPKPKLATPSQAIGEEIQALRNAMKSISAIGEELSSDRNKDLAAQIRETKQQRYVGYLDSLANSLERSFTKIGREHHGSDFKFRQAIPIDEHGLERLKVDKVVPESLTLEQVRDRNTDISTLLSRSK